MKHARLKKIGPLKYHPKKRKFRIAENITVSKTFNYVYTYIYKFLYILFVQLQELSRATIYPQNQKASEDVRGDTSDSERDCPVPSTRHHQDQSSELQENEDESDLQDYESHLEEGKNARYD